MTDAQSEGFAHPFIRVSWKWGSLSPSNIWSVAVQKPHRSNPLAFSTRFAVKQCCPYANYEINFREIIKKPERSDC